MNNLTPLDVWIDEFKQQISLAESIWKSDIPGHERIAFLLLDNSIEFMSKCYLKVIRNLVGTKKRHKISSNDWEEISRYFGYLMDTMKQRSPIPSQTIESIKAYHTVRNDLYHTSIPMAVTKSQFRDELKNTVEVFESLFRTKYESELIDVPAVLHKRPSLEDAISVVTGNQYVRVDIPDDWFLSQCIRVIIHGYTSLLGLLPTYEQIEHTLAISNRPTPKHKIRQGIRNLKYRGHIREQTEGEYSLTSEGRSAAEEHR
ncbi:MAG: hypothetical protein ACOC38_05435 [Promethearchaeia archaeon]